MASETSALDLGERSVSSEGVLRSISIQGLRSYQSLEARFGPGPQLIVGPNAAGKTTLLEAIVLLAWGRSHRTSSDGELVRWGSELARIEGIAGRETIEVALVRPSATGRAASPADGRWPARVRASGSGSTASAGAPAVSSACCERSSSP